MWAPTSWRTNCAKLFTAARDRHTLKQRLDAEARGEAPPKKKAKKPKGEIRQYILN
jgi:hypothetical protein